MGRTACTEPQCLYKGALYLYLRVELYLYSPYGPYSLHRASVPVQGWTLPLPKSRAIPLLPLLAVRPLQTVSACTRVHFTLLYYIYIYIYIYTHTHTHTHAYTAGSRFATVRFTTIHFHDPCPVRPSTPGLWCIAVATQVSFLHSVRF